MASSFEALPTKWIDDAIRSSNQHLRGQFFTGLLIFTFIVLIGVVLEESESIPIRRTTIDQNSGLSVPRHRLLRWLARLQKLGWVLVVVGVLGEFVFEGCLTRMDGVIEKFDAILLTAAQRDADDAGDSARRAALEARAAEGSAQNANIAAGGAQKKADSIAREAAELSNALQREQSGLNSISPRALVLSSVDRKTKSRFRELGGPTVEVTVCGLPQKSALPQRDLMEELDAWSALLGLLKGRGSVWEKCKMYGIVVFVSSDASAITKERSLNLFSELKMLLPAQTRRVVVSPEWQIVGRDPDSPYSNAAGDPREIIVLVGERDLPRPRTR